MIQKINNLLARSISPINAILALFLFVFGSISGVVGTMAFIGPLAFIVGPFLGIALAITVCGLLALLLDVRGLLRECRDLLQRQDQR